MTATTVAYNGGLSGEVVSRNNLISLISSNGGNGGMNGIIAAQGDLGVSLSIPGQPSRLGGVQVSGNVSGQVIVLGKARGDIIFSGGLKSGRITAKGGFLGNVILQAVDNKSAIVSGGLIGVPAVPGVTGTGLSVLSGTNFGIIAAKGLITFANSFTNQGSIFNNVGTSANGAAIDAIFTNNSLPLAFDLSGLDLQGLALIQSDLLALRVSNGTLTGTTA
jgi:hypothetical protein